MTVSPTIMDPVLDGLRFYTDAVNFVRCDLPPDAMKTAITLTDKAFNALKEAHAALRGHALSIDDPAPWR